MTTPRENTERRWQLRDYQPKDEAALLAAFVRYFADDLDAPLDAADQRLIQSESRRGIAEAYHTVTVALDDEGTLVGFILAQVDREPSDWILSPGDGFIRETWVAPDWRRSGLGRALVRAAEHKLLAQGVPRIYLTSDTADEFWTALGYRATGEICARNEVPIFDKRTDEMRACV